MNPINAVQLTFKKLMNFFISGKWNSPYLINWLIFSLWQKFLSQNMWNASQAIVFPSYKLFLKSHRAINSERDKMLVVMDECQSWTIKGDEYWRTSAFELCWRRLLRVSWTARISNQSVLKEINPECPYEELMMKLKLQDFGHLMQRADSLGERKKKPSCWERLRLRAERGDRGWEGWMPSLTQWTWVWASSRRQ